MTISEWLVRTEATRQSSDLELSTGVIKELLHMDALCNLIVAKVRKVRRLCKLDHLQILQAQRMAAMAGCTAAPDEVTRGRNGPSLGPSRWMLRPT